VLTYLNNKRRLAVFQPHTRLYKKCSSCHKWTTYLSVWIWKM